MSGGGTSRPRVLVLAEAANPDWVSVPLVGWSLAHALREVAEVHLVTQVRNREAILRAGYVEGEDFTAIDSEALARPAHRLAEALRMGENRGWTVLQAANALSYPWFERLVWRRFGAELKAGRYDLVHRITPLSLTAPSPIAKKLARAGVPFVLGPLNGGVPWPRGHRAARRAEREWLSPLRSVYKLLPGRRSTLKAAAAILVGSEFARADIPARHHPKTLWLPENGVDTARFSKRAAPRPRKPLRAVFVGRLVPLKACDLLIEAAAPLLEAGALRIDFVGDGPEMPRLQIRAAPYSQAVKFHGWQPHEAVQNILAEADLFTFPSIREFGGGAVLEAMALGLPPLVVDYAGPGELVDEEVGYKVPCLPPRDLVLALRGRLEEIIAAPELLATKGAAAAARVAAEFTWPAKARQVARVYDWVLAGTPDPAPALFGGAAPDIRAVGE